MLTSDYSSTTYQSRAGACEVVRWCLVWEKFSPTTDCEHITSHTKNTELVKQYHTLYSNKLTALLANVYQVIANLFLTLHSEMITD